MEYYIYLAFKCFTILINFTHGLASGFVVVGSLFIVASNVFCLFFFWGGEGGVPGHWLCLRYL